MRYIQKCTVDLEFDFFCDETTGRYAVHVLLNGYQVDNMGGFATDEEAKKYAAEAWGYCDIAKLHKLQDEYYNIHRFDNRLPELFELIAPGVLAEYLADKIQD